MPKKPFPVKMSEELKKLVAKGAKQMEIPMAKFIRKSILEKLERMGLYKKN